MKRKQQLFLSFAAIVFAGVIFCCAGLVYAQAREVVISTQKETLELSPPFTVINADMFKDGGTISVTIKDGREKIFALCFDGRAKMPYAERYLYANTGYPDDPDKKVEPGSEAAGRLLEILKSAEIVSDSAEYTETITKAMIEKIERKYSGEIQ